MVWPSRLQLEDRRNWASALLVMEIGEQRVEEERLCEGVASAAGMYEMVSGLV